VLGKLIKYDFKTQWQFFAFLFGACLLAPMLTYLVTINGERSIQLTFRVLASVFSVGGVMILTMIFAAKPFERDFNENGAYLMQTIPVRVHEMMISKSLLYYFWFVLACIVSLLAVGLAFMDFSFLGEIYDAMMRGIETGEIASSYDTRTGVSYFINGGMVLIRTILQPLAIYGFLISAMATGHLAGSRKKLGEGLFVVCFFILSSGYSGVILAIGAFPMLSSGEFNETLYSVLNYIDFFINIAVIAGFYIYTHYVFTKKINVL
jgi:hypothetical protein